MSSQNTCTVLPHLRVISELESSSAESFRYEPLAVPIDDLEDEIESKHSRWHAWYLATLEFMNGNVGLLLIIGAQLCFSAMYVTVKVLNTMEPHVSPFELITLRMSITYVLSMIYMLSAKVPDPWLGPQGIRFLLFVRGISGFLSVFGIYYSLQYLTLSDATALTFLAPLCIGIAGTIFLGEDYSVAQGIASLCSLAGVILIARPSFIFGATGTPADLELIVNEVLAPVETSETTPEQRLLAVGIALIGVIGGTGAYISITAMGKRAHPLHAMMSFSVQSVLAGSMAMLVMKTPIVFSTDPRWIGLVCMIGIFGFSAQSLLTMGLQRESAGRGSIAIYTQIVFATLLERIFFMVKPSAMSIAGTLIIVSSALYVAITKRRAAAKKSAVKLNSFIDDALEEGIRDGLLEEYAAEDRIHAAELDSQFSVVHKRSDCENEFVRSATENYKVSP